MEDRKFQPKGGPRRAALSCAVVAATLLHALDASSLAGTSQPLDAAAPAHVRRGNEVDALYHAFQERLDRLRITLGEELKREAPDLYDSLNTVPRGPVPHGYQILPRITPDPPPGQAAPKIASASYSWGRTERLIRTDARRLDEVANDVARAGGMPSDERRRLWEQAVRDYRQLADRQRLVDSLIQYNRLWQDDIARRRDVYDRSTRLHDAVIEREAIAAQVAGGEAVDPARRARAEALAREIQASTGRLSRPNFLRLERPSPHQWTIWIPLSTDIEDEQFLREFRAAVESTWHVKDGDDEFRVRLDIVQIPPARLYARRSPPARGAHIDLAAHLARFPEGRAILTTGASLTHVGGHWSVDLGPHDIAGRVLSHEVGHILGFVDGYFRGYRDRGGDGYEVLEVITDPDDIMSAPGFGRVHRHHFETLLESLGAPVPSVAGRPPRSASQLGASPAPSGRPAR